MKVDHVCLKEAERGALRRTVFIGMQKSKNVNMKNKL